MLFLNPASPDRTLAHIRTTDLLDKVAPGAGQILDIVSGLTELARIPPQELSRLSGLDEAATCRIAAIFELNRRRNLEKSSYPKLDSSSRAASFFRSHLEGHHQEILLGAYLDSQHRVIHCEEISRGTLTESLVHPREVFAPAIAIRAASLIVAHNHPSENPAPSIDDRETTRRLAQAGHILGIDLLDHVIIAGSRAYSFAEHESALFQPLLSQRSHHSLSKPATRSSASQ